MRFPTMWYMRPAKPQISLRIRAVWIRAFANRLNILWLLSYWLNSFLEFLSLKESYTGSSESTLVKMPHCWKSHVTARLYIWHVITTQGKLTSGQEQQTLPELLLPPPPRPPPPHLLVSSAFARLQLLWVASVAVADPEMFMGFVWTPSLPPPPRF